MIIVTAPDGHKLEINPVNITVIEPPLPGLYPTNVKTIIRVDGETHAVQETRDQIHTMMGYK